jgi:hypothetical protein
MPTHSIHAIVLCFLATFLLASTYTTAHAQEFSTAKKWYKGNTHTHSLWSDGDAAPEIVVEWYKEHGFDFLCLSEHNIFGDGSVQRWYPILPGTPLNPKRVEQLQEKYGMDAVELKHEHKRDYMRLKTIPELQKQFEDPEEFLLIPAEEITSNYPPIHVNAINIRELAPAVNFVDTIEGIVANFEFVRNQSEKYNIPTLATFNHPNWRDGFPVETVLDIDGPMTFEIFNGHPYVWNFGDPDTYKISYDRFWDIALAIRLKRDPRNMLYGIAVSDSHEYFKMGPKEANPGRGFVMVQAEALTPNAIVTALQKGDYYSSSGVMLNSIETTKQSMSINIQTEPEVAYTTQFIGTRKGFDDFYVPVVDKEGNERYDRSRVYSDDIGEVLLETTDNPAKYRFKGNEIYVRAKIVSSKPLDSPFTEGGTQTAWVQPVLIDP